MVTTTNTKSVGAKTGAGGTGVAFEDPRIAYGERLTSRQRLFVEAVALGKSHTEAARHAGYYGDRGSSSNASHLAAIPKIQNAIARARAVYEETREFTLAWWRSQLADAHAQAVLAKDLPSRLRALELAGRHLGALESRADAATAELSARLTQHLVQAMAIQMATATAETPLTVEGEIRRVFPSVSPSVADSPAPLAYVRGRARA